MWGFAMAGGLAALGMCVHTLLGSRSVVQPFLRAQDLPHRSRWLMFLCWHAVSVLLVVMAGGFAWAALSAGARELGVGMTVLAGLLAVLTYYVARRARFDPLKLPPFVLFSLMAAGGAWSSLA
ncbi:MAG: hypothetical protein K1X35_03625 [Caulobacteraceae bacterium]|nr:hypothetical protein [Caulobacteraceae bacterium]